MVDDPYLKSLAAQIMATISTTFTPIPTRPKPDRTTRRRADADEQGGAGIQPRIVDSPQATTLAKLNEQILLSCLAQGSPRPTMRWFKQLAHNNDWIELAADQLLQQQQQQPNNSSEPKSLQQRYSILADGNVLLIKSPQQSDNRAKFRCLANNTFGMHHADTELRLELYPQSKLVEIEPKIEYINNQNELRAGQQQQQQHAASSSSSSSSYVTRASFNCTIRASNVPLVAIEWLKNGKLLASISLPQYSQLVMLPKASPVASFHQPPASAASNSSSQASSNVVSMFDEPNQELTLIEQFAAIDDASDGRPRDDDFSPNAPPAEPMDSGYEGNAGLENLIVRATSLTKLEQQFDEIASIEPDRTLLQTAQRLSQRVRFSSPKDRTSLLYQLRFSGGPLRRSDRGSYQCRARTTRGAQHATGQLLLKDTPPVFMETFPHQLINTESIQSPQASLKCIASGSPLPEISWRLSGFQIPESSRYRVGDYVTRDGLIVSFVNITNVQAEGECFSLSLSSFRALQLIRTTLLSVRSAGY